MTMGILTVCNIHSSVAGQYFFVLPDDDRGGLYTAASNWFPRMRNAVVQGPGGRHAGLFFELWRGASFGNGQCMMGEDWASTDSFAGYETGDGGKRNTYYIKGTVLDENSDPVPGAVVKGYRTSDGLYIGQVGTGSEGQYMLPTPYSVSHFVVAYLDTATDLAGTTVNNLTPTTS